MGWAERANLTERDGKRRTYTKTPTHTERMIVAGAVYIGMADGSLRRKLPKVKGKAAVKLAKRARHAARKIA